VVAERERPPAIEADHLEDAVASIETVVRQRQDGIGGRRDGAVDRCELGDRHGARLSESVSTLCDQRLSISLSSARAPRDGG
jgi:hypothetical protein